MDGPKRFGEPGKLSKMSSITSKSRLEILQVFSNTQKNFFRSCLLSTSYFKAKSASKKSEMKGSVVEIGEFCSDVAEPPLGSVVTSQQQEIMEEKCYQMFDSKNSQFFYITAIIYKIAFDG